MSKKVPVLQAVRLKGRPTAADIAAVSGMTAEAVTGLLSRLVTCSYVTEARGRYKLSANGKAHLESLIAAERLEIDGAALLDAYRDFDGFNSAFKQIVTEWQLINGVTPNDHTDTSYDAGIIRRLAELHERFRPVLRRMVAIAPRLLPYPDRFSAALTKVRDGDHGWLARPLIDSYHTVWFELHEDLLGLAGLSRVAEAAEGRAG